jgi:hypothetical protein
VSEGSEELAAALEKAAGETKVGTAGAVLTHQHYILLCNSISSNGAEQRARRSQHGCQAAVALPAMLSG